MRKTRHLANPVSRKVSRIKSLHWAATAASLLLWPTFTLLSVSLWTRWRPPVCSAPCPPELHQHTGSGLLDERVGQRRQWGVRSLCLTAFRHFTLHSDSSPTVTNVCIFQADTYTVNHELIAPFVHVLPCTEGKAEPPSSCLMIPRIWIKHMHSCFTANSIWLQVKSSFLLYMCMKITI